MSEATYIEIDHISEEGLEGNFGIKIDAPIKQGVSALEVVKKLFSGTNNITDARFISAEEYEAEYGEDDGGPDEWSDGLLERRGQ